MGKTSVPPPSSSSPLFFNLEAVSDRAGRSGSQIRVPCSKMHSVIKAVWRCGGPFFFLSHPFRLRLGIFQTAAESAGISMRSAELAHEGRNPFFAPFPNPDDPAKPGNQRGFGFVQRRWKLAHTRRPGPSVVHSHVLPTPLSRHRCTICKTPRRAQSMTLVLWFGADDAGVHRQLPHEVSETCAGDQFLLSRGAESIGYHRYIRVTTRSRQASDCVRGWRKRSA